MYYLQKNATVPPDLAAALAANPVNIASVSDSNDQDEKYLVVDLVDDAVVPGRAQAA